jgi:hypothetical protein
MLPLPLQGIMNTTNNLAYYALSGTLIGNFLQAGKCGLEAAGSKQQRLATPVGANPWLNETATATGADQSSAAVVDAEVCAAALAAAAACAPPPVLDAEAAADAAL